MRYCCIFIAWTPLKEIAPLTGFMQPSPTENTRRENSVVSYRWQPKKEQRQRTKAALFLNRVLKIRRRKKKKKEPDYSKETRQHMTPNATQYLSKHSINGHKAVDVPSRPIKSQTGKVLTNEISEAGSSVLMSCDMGHMTYGDLRGKLSNFLLFFAHF